MPYTDVTGVAAPINTSEVLGSFDAKIENGIRTQNADVIPCTITGILFPHPLKYPALENRIHVSTQSAENPRR